MIDFSSTILSECIIHHIGNKHHDEKCITSKKELQLTDEQEAFLTKYFLDHFKKNSEAFVFTHAVDIKLNVVMSLADNIFEEEDFIKNSGLIAKHLYQETKHGAIKSGELFVVLFEDILFEDVISTGLGIFKAERKDNFFTVNSDNGIIEVDIQKGINPQKIDKACLIFNNQYSEGFRVFTYEHNNADTEYWRNDFLGITTRKDNYQHTKNFLSVCKEFVSEKMPQDYEVTKADQIDLLNKSIDYFKKNKDFEMKEFTKEVFAEPELIKSFKQFKEEYQDEHDLEIEESFDVSTPAVKKQVRNYKSVLKLDKNFHVYIHGDRSKIEQGVEKDGRKYYKIYFEKEL